MERNINEHLAILLNVGAGIIVIIASIFVDIRLPIIYRAKLEEKALARKFGAEWEKYSKQTAFFLPILG